MKRKNKEREESSMKKTFKKLLALTLTGVLVAGALSGCGKKEDKDSKTDSKTITIAASATPHAEILEYAKTSKGKRI